MCGVLVCFYFLCDVNDVCQLLTPSISIFTKNTYYQKERGHFFYLVEFCNEFCNNARIKAAPGMCFPIKSSSQKKPRLVSNYASLCTLILKPFIQRNDFQSAKSSASWRQPYVTNN